MKYVVEDSNKIDLHIHTNVSDGKESCIEIIRQAINLRLEYISITDHNIDDISSFINESELEDLYNLKIIPGCELSVIHKGKRLHLLAYDYNSLFNKFVIPKIGYMREKGKPITLKKACKLIHLFGGIAIIAHPFKYKCDGKELIEDLLKEKCLDGIECIHSYNTQEEIDYLLNVCEKNNLYVSAGSDYHYGGRLIKGAAEQHTLAELPVSNSTIEEQLKKAKQKYNTNMKR